MPYTDECSNRMEMALLRENPPSKAFFLSIAVVGGPHSRVCGILWGCGSNYFMGEKSNFLKGQSKWQLEKESKASSASGAQEADLGR